MTAPQFMEHARELDRDIQFLDALRDAALRTQAHPRIRLRLLALRNELAKAQGAAWQTRKVEP